ncbi:hypothetical protein QRD89_03680 [Halobacillus sp. ACCC02827]|uniref:hypothetical protein n=1 Tax=Bacillaceae TaxID=186817 RepID=UPI00040BA6FA|nr:MULTISPECIES: hypothetical protein [Bacillaceae]QHT45669.1 hypothetical protein M662_03815 [Bacillus sp. SB49]WJE16469.1 hypothetical protein QRD89_03680 [Halobacillus sp. ACCC02827]
MRHDIKPNERAYSTKEVAEEVGIATTTVRKYGQILERNGYEFFKDGDRRIFVRSDIEALMDIRDTDLPKDEKAKELVKKLEERLSGYDETQIAVADTDSRSLQDPAQLKELLTLVAKELAATREVNMQLKEDMEQLKTTVSRLQQDHHVISSGVGNFSQKTHAKLEKLTNEQKRQYETLLEQEKEKSEHLQRELREMRTEQKREWQSQNDFNRRLEVSVGKPQGTLGKLLSLFRK